MTSLLEHFIPEAGEYLASATAGLLKLERNPSDEGLINEVFRAVHTLKGSSGLFDVPGLTRLVHAGEDLLVEVRAGQLRLDSEIVDLLLDALDRVSAWVDDLARHGTLPEDAESVSVTLSRRLRARMTGAAKSETAAPVAVEGPPNWLAEVPEADRIAAFRATMAGGRQLYAIEHKPDEGCFYRGEDPFNLFRQLPELLALLPVPRGVPATLASADPFQCTLHFRALVATPRAEVEHLFRYVIEQTLIAPIAPQTLIIPCGDAGEHRIKHAFIAQATEQLAARDWAGLRRAIAMLLDETEACSWEASALRWLDVILATALPNLAWAASLIDCLAEGRNTAFVLAQSEAPVASGNSVVARLLAEQRRNLGLGGTSDDIKRRVAGIEATVGAMLVSLAMTDHQGELTAAAALAAGGKPERLDALLAVLERAVTTPVTPVASPVLDSTQMAATETRPLSRVLKVDQGKVDALMNLIAELVVSKNSLPFLAKRAEDVYGSREMSREIKDQYAVIDRLAQELQRSIMDVRMLPVSEVFERFTRLVRDLARKLDKHIALKIVGEETAADKTIIEALGDPLIHLVRNAIDHGIEMPEDRADAGKSETATILLKAYQESDRVIVEVSDDGCGIDPDVIRRKAIEKGVVTAEQAAALSDQGAVDLVFMPGFSTAAQISDLSGRGVGMDVVRTAIEKIGGHVSISSRKGEGTLVRLSLPLSMAVTRVMMVEAAGGLFGIPMDMVTETVRVPVAHIRKIKQAETFVLRDAIVPLVRMSDLLQTSVTNVDASDEAVVVTEVGGKAVGLVIDKFREGIDVILKPLDGVLAGMKAYCGSALLGDGHILLVLNLKELL